MSLIPSRRSSTLENWCREFERFVPSISIQTYYADKDDRPLLRETLLETRLGKGRQPWEVLITTYNLAVGDERDRKFFRKIDWNVRFVLIIVFTPTNFFILDVCIRRRSCPQELSVAEVYGTHALRRQVEAPVDRHSTSEQPSGACCTSLLLQKLKCPISEIMWFKVPHEFHPSQPIRRTRGISSGHFQGQR